MIWVGRMLALTATTSSKPLNLDQLAGEGLIFDRFYSASAVCSPTRGSCLTGRHPQRYGIFHANSGHLPKEEITVPELLKTKWIYLRSFWKVASGYPDND